MWTPVIASVIANLLVMGVRTLKPNQFMRKGILLVHRIEKCRATDSDDF